MSRRPILIPAEVVTDRLAPLPDAFDSFSTYPLNDFIVLIGRGARRRHPERYTDDDPSAPLRAYPCPVAPINPCPGSASTDAGRREGQEDDEDDDDDDDDNETVDFLSELPQGSQAQARLLVTPPQAAPPALALWYHSLSTHLRAAGLTQSSADAFIAELHVARFCRGDVILKKGGIGDRAFVVVSGVIDVVPGTLGSAGARAAPVAQLHGGDHFGFVSMVAMQPWVVSMVVSSAEGAELRFIDRFDFAQSAIREPLLLIVSVALLSRCSVPVVSLLSRHLVCSQALHSIIAENVALGRNYTTKQPAAVAPLGLSTSPPLTHVTATLRGAPTNPLPQTTVTHRATPDQLVSAAPRALLAASACLCEPTLP